MSREFPAASLARLLAEGMQQLHIRPATDLVDRLLAYLQLLRQWNRAYNLTAIRDYERMVSHHLLDSLTLLPYLRGGQCLDVGSGAGLPGLVLAMAEPERHWTLLDSSQKKIRFLRHVLLELQITNVVTVCERVESYKPALPFSTLVCRAYSSLDKIVSQTAHLLDDETVLLAMKGPDCRVEVQALDASALAIEQYVLTVPGIDTPRTLVEIKALPS